MKRLICGAVTLLVLLAPATVRAGFMGIGDVEFIPYEGKQQQWPTAPGATVDRSYKLPVYYGRPPRAYAVLGTVKVSGTGGFTQEASAIRDAIAEARKHGAEAVIMMDRGTDPVSAFVTGSAAYGFHVRDRASGRAQVIAIKWRK